MNITKISLFGGGLILIFFLLWSLYFFFPQKNELQAAAGDLLQGFAWSPNIGWISFNSINCDTDDNGVSDAPLSGCPSAGTPMAKYGVNVALPAQGKKALSGYAWAADIGYVTFNQSELGGCPGPSCQAEVDFDNGTIEGWARACSVFASGCSGALRPASESGNWDGWISLQGTATNADAYGVNLDLVSCGLSGFAWGGGDDAQFPGWISFQGQATDGSDYGVSISETNQAPDTPTGLSLSANTDKPGTYCPAPWVFIFSWNYSDPDGNDMSTYQIQVAKDPGFTDLLDLGTEDDPTPLTATSGTTVSVAKAFCSPSASLGCGTSSKFSFDTDYWWQVKVWDSGSAVCQAAQKESSWSSSDTFLTPDHDWPKTNFHSSPAKPSVGETVTFKNDTSFDDGSTGQSYLWTFTGTSPPTDIVFEPSRVYTTKGTYDVTLQATDDVGSCTLSKPAGVLVAPALPEYKEVAPK